MNRQKQTLLYLISDFLSAVVAWHFFSTIRRNYIETSVSVDFTFFELTPRYLITLIGVPLAWLFLYLATGYYNKIFRKSRIKELSQTFMSCLSGSIIIFFALILDDPVYTYHNFYILFVLLFFIHFFPTWIFRFIITSITKNKIYKGKIGFKTILIGSNESALNLYEEIQKNDKGYGYKFIGFIDIQNNTSPKLKEKIKHLGNFKDLNSLIEKYSFEEVIVAIESSEQEKIEQILTKLEKLDVIIKVIPSLYDVLTGKVQMSFFLGTPLIIISHKALTKKEESLKRTFDIVFSFFAIIFSSPILFISMIGVKLNSKGEIFYIQERIGKHGKPFKIIKLRTMIADAEKNGPQLSSAFDPRITKFGRFLRKYRIDEIPQFINVLKGDMSIVGPRPERQFYINQIIEKAPHYTRLHTVRPGITSWGAVKFGYTETVEEMIEQLKYDIFYIENISFYLDIKILIYTVLVVLKKQGK